MIDLEKYNFTVSQKKILSDIKKDLFMWNETPFEDLFPDQLEEKYPGKQLSKKIFEYYVKKHKELQVKPNDYRSFDELKYETRKYTFQKIEKKGMGLGACPVASNGTRCCNLLTLDAVESCGFDCSIQSFYNQNKIGFDKDFKTKLENLELDPNVILKFKTKSDNIKYFLENEVPKNIIVTWSLNTPMIIKNEEHLTASLDERISSARKLANKGVLVGFHFHPIVVYKDYLKEYKEIYDKLLETFTPDEGVLISMGTLTFIKPVIKQLREKQMKTKILQMPFETINGKQSYSIETKKEMFKRLYESFKHWHGKVYFYMCMEAHSLWKDVFGYEYSSNN